MLYRLNVCGVRQLIRCSAVQRLLRARPRRQRRRQLPQWLKRGLQETPHTHGTRLCCYSVEHAAGTLEGVGGLVVVVQRELEVHSAAEDIKSSTRCGWPPQHIHTTLHVVVGTAKQPRRSTWRCSSWQRHRERQRKEKGRGGGRYIRGGSVHSSVYRARTQQMAPKVCVRRIAAAVAAAVTTRRSSPPRSCAPCAWSSPRGSPCCAGRPGSCRGCGRTH